ncbi:hypothetical protein EVAR_49578_1 [Eumeta japonica]|uniref:Uncharacterized protein n=1 Tax=Eumeta variegata TaxID=151549 RepID=A0A4C1YRG3_EUMVA|nr:hypothetical protein EVAR_49578_1 [Eumeta japonica]
MLLNARLDPTYWTDVQLAAQKVEKHQGNSISLVYNIRRNWLLDIPGVSRGDVTSFPFQNALGCRLRLRLSRSRAGYVLKLHISFRGNVNRGVPRLLGTSATPACLTRAGYCTRASSAIKELYRIITPKGQCTHRKIIPRLSSTSTHSASLSSDKGVLEKKSRVNANKYPHTSSALTNETAKGAHFSRPPGGTLEKSPSQVTNVSLSPQDEVVCAEVHHADPLPINGLTYRDFVQTLTIRRQQATDTYLHRCRIRCNTSLVDALTCEAREATSNAPTPLSVFRTHAQIKLSNIARINGEKI